MVVYLNFLKRNKFKLKFEFQLYVCQIGSSPGFEDGKFESAKLTRPAASVYVASEDCLYFVDSEVWDLKLIIFLVVMLGLYCIVL